MHLISELAKSATDIAIFIHNLQAMCHITDESNITKISRLRGCPTLWNKNVVSFLTFNFINLSSLVWENRQNFLFPPPHRYATISLVSDPCPPPPHRYATISLVPDPCPPPPHRCATISHVPEPCPPPHRYATISLVPDPCPHRYATISLVPDPRVINPSVMSTTAVVLHNNINLPFSDGCVLSIMVHKQLVLPEGYM